MSQWEQVVLAVIVSIIASVQLTAMLFYCLIFPLINKFFNKSFPCYDFSKTCDDWMDGYFRQTMVKLEVEKAIMPRKNPVPPIQPQQREAQKPARFIDVHKDVETVRLPKVIASDEQKEEKLTMTKIDFAARRIIKGDSNKQTSYSTKAQKPTSQEKPKVEKPSPAPSLKKTDDNIETKSTVAKRPTKAIKKDKTVETFELSLPTHAPEMDVKKTSDTKTTQPQTKTPQKRVVSKRENRTVETVEIPPPKSSVKK